MAKRYVLYSPTLGVYLGYAGCQTFWSKTGGLAYAYAFRDPVAAMGHRAQFNVLTAPADIELKPVHTPNCWATIAECKAAGLPGWVP